MAVRIRKGGSPIPFSCRLLGHRCDSVDIAACPKHGATFRSIVAEMVVETSGIESSGTLPRSVPEGATSVEVSALPKPRRETKFTATIYCGNCRTVGDYQFRKGTILHAANDFTWAEYRNGTPTDRKATIRLNNRTNGTLVECRFCKCSTALTIRERNGETTS